MIENSFKIWHGSRRWTGSPELRPAKQGRAEWGAGIYGSTHFSTASKYAKGGGMVQLLTLAPGHVLEKTAIPLSLGVQMVKDLLPRRVAPRLIGDLHENCERMKSRIDAFHRLGDEKESLWVPASVIRNLCVNENLSSGARGVAVSRFFADLGISYSIDNGGSERHEYWIVIFDPAKIADHQPHSYETAKAIGHILPSPLDQGPRALRVFEADDGLSM